MAPTDTPAFTVEHLLVANPHGYCAGVLFALRGVDLARQIYPDHPVWVYHEIVHNPDPVNELKALGIHFCNDVAEAPDGAVLVFSAHGISPAVRRQAAERAFRAVVDLTCPLVARVHDAVRRHAPEQIILVGKPTHDETVGTMGEVPEHTHVVSSPADVAGLDLPAGEAVVYVTQTTWSIQDAAAIIAEIRKRFPGARPAIPSAPGDASGESGSICYATENRQQAVIAGSARADVVLVIGGVNSENTANLVHTAQNNGARAYRITRIDELERAWLEGARTVLITSGASTPEYRLDEVIAWFAAQGVADIRALGEPEAMQLSVPEGFALPAALRAAIRRRETETGTTLQPLTRAAQPWRGARFAAPAAADLEQAGYAT